MIKWKIEIYYLILFLVILQLLLEKVFEMDYYAEIRYLSGLLTGIFIFRILLEAIELKKKGIEEND